MNHKPVVALYVDGGVILKNPSPIAGTWAYVLVDIEDQRVLKKGSGVMIPAEWGLDVITNNQSEMWAMLKGLAVLPDNVPSNVCPDSQTTLGRCFWGHRWTNVPPDMHTEFHTQRARLDENWKNIKGILHAGHPTIDQLAKGIGRNGLPVSKWNCLCDRMCTQAGEAYLDSLKVRL